MGHNDFNHELPISFKLSESDSTNRVLGECTNFIKEGDNLYCDISSIYNLDLAHITIGVNGFFNQYDDNVKGYDYRLELVSMTFMPNINPLVTQLINYKVNV